MKTCAKCGDFIDRTMGYITRIAEKGRLFCFSTKPILRSGCRQLYTSFCGNIFWHSIGLAHCLQKPTNKLLYYIHFPFSILCYLMMCYVKCTMALNKYTPYYTIPYDTIRYHTIPYHTIRYHTIPYDTIPYHTIPYHTIPYHTIPYHTIPYHTIPYHTIPYHTIPYHTIQERSKCSRQWGNPKRVGLLFDYDKIRY